MKDLKKNLLLLKYSKKKLFLGKGVLNLFTSTKIFKARRKKCYYGETYHLNYREKQTQKHMSVRCVRVVVGGCCRK